MLDPRLAFTCLTALLKGAQSPALPAAQPQVYERLLEVFLELASSPETSEATLDLLRQVQLVPSQLSTVVSLLGSKQVGSSASHLQTLTTVPCACRAGGGQPLCLQSAILSMENASPCHILSTAAPALYMLHVSCAQSVADLAPHKLALHLASCHGALRAGTGVLAQGKGAVLRQCAWLLQLAALQLHRADLAVLAHREDCKRLLTALYDVAPAAADAGISLLPPLSLFCWMPCQVCCISALNGSLCPHDVIKVTSHRQAEEAGAPLCSCVCRRGWQQHV